MCARHDLWSSQRQPPRGASAMPRSWERGQRLGDAGAAAGEDGGARGAWGGGGGVMSTPYLGGALQQHLQAERRSLRHGARLDLRPTRAAARQRRGGAAGRGGRIVANEEATRSGAVGGARVPTASSGVVMPDASAPAVAPTPTDSHRGRSGRAVRRAARCASSSNSTSWPGARWVSAGAGARARGRAGRRGRVWRRRGGWRSAGWDGAPTCSTRKGTSRSTMAR